MKRPWRLFCETASRMASAPMTGYAYATKENAERGLQRLIDSGDLHEDEEGVARTPGLWLRVSVGHDGS